MTDRTDRRGFLVGAGAVVGLTLAGEASAHESPASMPIVGDVVAHVSEDAMDVAVAEDTTLRIRIREDTVMIGPDRNVAAVLTEYPVTQSVSIDPDQPLLDPHEVLDWASGEEVVARSISPCVIGQKS